jgi:hypothetical protein
MVARMKQNTKRVAGPDAKYEIEVEIENFTIDIEKDQFDNIIYLIEIAGEF